MERPLNKKQLLDLSVYTKSGQHLGRVVDFLYEPSSQTIIQYTVRNTDILNTLLPHREFLVSEKQVIAVTAERMVVDDTLTPVSARAATAAPTIK